MSDNIYTANNISAEVGPRQIDGLKNLTRLNFIYVRLRRIQGATKISCEQSECRNWKYSSGKTLGVLKRFFLGFCTLALFLISSSSASAATLQKPPNNLGLVGYWPMNEGTSTQAGDFSGRGNTGTLTNMATPPTATSGWGNGKLGGGLSFDGTNDYVNLPGTLSDISGTVSTVSMWIRLNAYDTFGCIPFGITNIYWQIGNNTTAYVQGGSAITITSTPFTDGNWRFLVMTSDGTTKKVYVNGALVGSATAAGTNIPTGAKNAAIGDYISGLASTWTCNGQLDDVRLYNRALSSAEVTNLYQSGSAKINTSQNNKVTNGLVGLWSFDGADMSGNTAYDRSTSGNNGTLTNGPARAIGKVGQGMSFDGVDDYVQLNEPANLKLNFPFTYTAWVKVKSAAGWIYAYGNQNDCIDFAYRGVGIKLSSTYIAAYFNSGISCVVSDRKRKEANISVDIDTWHHVTVVYNNATDIRLYLDSNDVGGSYIGSAATLGYGVGYSALVGARHDGSVAKEFFPGTIDDVRIYNRALTQAEITQLYNMGGSKLNAPQNNIPGSTLQSGLVGFWPFNGPDMSGNTAYDRSTSGNNGTLTNGPVRTIGKVGQGLSFDGVNDYVDVPYTGIDFERTDPHSFSFWANWTSGGASPMRSFIGRYAGTRGEDVFCYKTTVSYANAQAITFYLQGAGSNLISISSPINSITYGKWNHVVVTYDGSSSASGVKIYINGVNQTLTTHWNTLTTTTKQNVNWQIGNDQTSDPLQGSVDEMRIYNRVLTQAEVTQLYNLGK